MRRIFRDTTSIALGLSLVLPSIASAQPLPVTDVARIGAERAANMPELAAALAREQAAGLEVSQLNCLMNAPKPCTPGTPLLTPQGIAVQLGEDNSLILAPADQQINRTDGQGGIVPAHPKRMYNAPRADAGNIRLAQADTAPVVVVPGQGPVETDASVEAVGKAVSDAEAAAKSAAAAADEAAKKAAEAARKAAEKPADKAEAKEAAPKAEAKAAPKDDAANAEADAARAAAAGDAETAAVKPKAADKAAEKAPEKQAQPKAEATAKPAADAAAAEADAAREAAGAAAKKTDDSDAVVVKPAAKAVEKPADAAKAADTEADAARASAGAAAKTDAAAAVPKADAAKPAAKAAGDAAAQAADDAAKAAEDAANASRAAVTDATKAGSDAVKVTPSGTDESQKSEADIARALAERQAADEAAKAAATDTGKAADKAAAGGNVPVVTPAAPAGGQAAPAVSAAEAAERDALAEALANATAIPEESAKETDAARAAAAAASAPSAAALEADAKPVVTTEKAEVTDANSRAATEDFSTDLNGQARNAIAAAAAAAAGGNNPVVEGGGNNGDNPVVVGGNGNGDGKEARKDDESDLEKALKGVVLPALAGMVVGQVISNNREVALNTGDRVVVTLPDGSQQVIKDDNALMLRPGSTVQSEEYADGSSRTVVTRADGSQVVTIRDANLQILRRTVVYPDGTSTALIDDTTRVQPVDVAALPRPAQPVVILPGEQVSDEALREALRRETDVNRSFTLGQIRNIPEVRALVAPVDIQSITFDTGSAAIKADQAQALSALGRVIAEQVRQNPREMYLIEGYTDTVGQSAMNLALSDRRAESVALALNEFFGVPPENMVVQGYGEQFLKIAQEGDIRANRRAAVRRITDLLDHQ